VKKIPCRWPVMITKVPSLSDRGQGRREALKISLSLSQAGELQPRQDGHVRGSGPLQLVITLALWQEGHGPVQKTDQTRKVMGVC
jgi:hypothetical protein